MAASLACKCLFLVVFCVGFVLADVYLGPYDPHARNVPYSPNLNRKRGIAVFQWNYTNPSTPAALKTALDYAGNSLICSLLDMIQPIVVQVSYSSLGANILGAARPSAYCYGPRVTYGANIYWPVPSWDNSKGQNDPNCPSPTSAEAGFDMNATFSDGVNWDYNTDANAPIASDAVSFVTVALHELIHGLGFSSLYEKLANGSINNWASPQDPSLYDYYLRVGQTSTTIGYSSPETDLQSNNIYFFDDTSSYTQIYAPSPWAQGSSIVHITGDSGLNQLMKPSLGPGIRIYYPGQLALIMLRTMGWSLSASALLTQLTSTTTTASTSISTSSTSTTSTSLSTSATSSSTTSSVSYTSTIGPSTTSTALQSSTSSTTSRSLTTTASTSSTTSATDSSTSSTSATASSIGASTSGSTTGNAAAALSSSTSSTAAISSSTSSTVAAAVSSSTSSTAAISSSTSSSTSSSSSTRTASTSSTTSVALSTSTSSTTSTVSMSTSTTAGITQPPTPTTSNPNASQGNKKKFPIVIVAAAIGGGLLLCILLIVLAVVIKKCCCTPDFDPKHRRIRNSWAHDEPTPGQKQVNFPHSPAHFYERNFVVGSS